MGTISRIGIVSLLVVSFAGGILLRSQYEQREEALAARRKAAQQPSVSSPMYASADGAANVDFSPVQTLYEVLRNLREHYVEQLTPNEEGKMTYDALKSMLGSLKDPNTRFIEPAQRKIITEQFEGKYHGIGAVLCIKSVKSGGMTDERLIVVNTLPGSPAAEAGLNPGDSIVAIDGKPILSFDPFQRIDKMVKDSRNSKVDTNKLKKEFEAEQKRIENGMLVMEAESTLMSEDKKAVELSVVANGSKKETKVKIQPAEFSVEPVASKMLEGGKTGYIRINCFTNRTAELFANAMKDMNSAGAESLVLDLRNLSGGETDTALQVAKWFAPKQRFAVVARSRDRKVTINIPSIDKGEAWRKPLAVLVDRGTARLPEVLAAALKDDGVAKLVGEKTFGDFAEVTLIDQVDGSAFTMTTGTFLTPKGVSHAGKGLAVDTAVASIGRNDDNVLKEAVKVLGTAGSGS